MDIEQMNIVDHLSELRKRIFITLGTFLFAFSISFIYVKEIYYFLVKDLDGKLALLGPGDIIWIYMMISGVVAIAITIPVAAFETWKFVKPALSKEEQKITLPYIPGLFFLFIAGIAFGYFILFPLVLSFLSNLSDGLFETFFTAEKYFSFMLNIVLPFGFLFEMPAVVMFLTRIGVINPYKLGKMRKFAYFLLIIISVLITPPDFLSDVLVIIPLLLLYEVSILLSKIVYRKQLASDSSVTAN
ncbi:twin-arginine translocase subunit TatC [Bacillus sp. B15-48]|uniref:twin-arginine translocase subunit TatC n=1 Tax=Bacillus sp. B15-48 TaxID=1548601 RepID=UPI00193EE2A4|nr:twin-arginine translocase subunit TatC [Bacillus sp. B15-48]MBM4760934.1 twin-arginine translocase subunit TatC [Bacillus sp. B15-48]